MVIGKLGHIAQGRCDHMKIDVPRLLFALGIKDATLRRNEWWAKCPFPGHQEKEPSWSIRDQPELASHGFHKCFGCKQGGGPVQLVQLCIGITAQSANRWLHENGLVLGEALGGIPEIKVSVGGSQRYQTKLPPLCAILPMEDWPTMARKYATERGITPQHVLRYKLGYAVHGRLAGRIVLPSYNARGEVANYTARSFTGDSKRYSNALTSENYPLKTALFGEHLWDELPSGIVFTAEGAINALAIDTAVGSKFAVAAFCGSRISPVQVHKLSRFSKVVHVADPDFTGREFACTVEAALKSACEVYVIQLQDEDAAGTDPKVLRRELSHGVWW